MFRILSHNLDCHIQIFGLCIREYIYQLLCRSSSAKSTLYPHTVHLEGSALFGIAIDVCLERCRVALLSALDFFPKNLKCYVIFIIACNVFMCNKPLNITLGSPLCPFLFFVYIWIAIMYYVNWCTYTYVHRRVTIICANYAILLFK